MKDGRSIIKNFATSDPVIDHDIETCGHCFQLSLFHTVAREMHAAGDYDVKNWSLEVARRWEAGKFYQLWKVEHEAGRDPHEAFEARGWMP